MPDFNAHGLDPSWAEPEAEQVQEFFDKLSEKEGEMLTQSVPKRAKASMGGQPSAGTSSAPLADQENIGTVIEEVTRDAEAEANKIFAEEAADEDATKEPAGKAGEATAEEASKGAAEEGAVNDQPSSSVASARANTRRYVGDVSQAHEELKVAQNLLAERKLELIMKQADIEKTQEAARELAANDEAAQHQHQAELNSQ
nr:uncharacterized protein LOC109737472 [Aegilops tauschii subsp. strangulata]